MMNSCNFIGRLVDEPKHFEDESGSRVVFTLAVDRDNGAAGVGADFLDFIAWGEVADTILNEYHKGDLMNVCNARAKVHTYVDSKQQKKRKTEYKVTSVYHLPDDKAHREKAAVAN